MARTVLAHRPGPRSRSCSTVAARAAGLGPLTLVEGLGGSPRSLVGRVTDGSDTYVVKVTGLQEGDTWARETSALAAAEGSGVSPRLLGADAQTRLIVMSDLGSAPPVSDRLMGGTPEAADTGLVAWARGDRPAPRGRRRAGSPLRRDPPASTRRASTPTPCPRCSTRRPSHSSATPAALGVTDTGAALDAPAGGPRPLRDAAGRALARRRLPRQQRDGGRRPGSGRGRAARLRVRRGRGTRSGTSPT